jgi:hypothetical protein
MINGVSHPPLPAPTAADVREAAAFLFRALAVVLLVSAVPFQIALWRWAL